MIISSKHTLFYKKKLPFFLLILVIPLFFLYYLINFKTPILVGFLFLIFVIFISWIRFYKKIKKVELFDNYLVIDNKKIDFKKIESICYLNFEYVVKIELIQENISSTIYFIPNGFFIFNPPYIKKIRKHILNKD